jgi:hypothetical protein
MSINDETKKVKKALKAAGYPVSSCKHGRGTAYCWIEIMIDDYRHPIKNGKRIDQNPAIMNLIYQTIGSTEQVLVQYSKNHMCRDCVVFNTCTNYHTADTCGSACFTNREMMEQQEKEYREYLALQEANKTDPIKVSYFVNHKGDPMVKIQNVVVNCGATFMIPESRFNALVTNGKTKDQIFDHLAYEDMLEKKAEDYRQECERNREKAGHPWVYDGYGHRDNIGGPWGTPVQKPGNAIREITITRAEGPAELCDKPHYFDNWQDASSWLRSQSSTFPKGGCYDKHDFKVVFVDGEDYSGRLDCKHHTEPDNDLNLLEHIRHFCEFQAGRAKDTWCEPEEYQKIIAGKDPADVKAYGEFIDQYLLSEVSA